MKKDRKLKKSIAWIAFGVAISTTIIRLYLLSVQNTFSISSATINVFSYFGYIGSLILLIFYYIGKSRNSNEK